MLTEQLADAKGEMLRGFEILEQWETKAKLLTDQLQRTHRCWPSRWGWGIAAFLAAYAIFMHSHFFAELETAKVLRTQFTAEIATLQTRVEQLETPVVKNPWWRRR